MDDKKISIFIYCDDYQEQIISILGNEEYIYYSNQDFTNQDVDFVIIETDEDIEHINLQFEIKNELVQYIAIQRPFGLNKFFKQKGRGVLDFPSLNNELGKIILRKFFKQQDSIYLDEVYADLFSNYETAGISNHLLSGIFVDKICLAAFNSHFNNVTIRTFLDHVIYYFAYLKQAGLALTPFEFQYGHNQDSFILKAHVKVNNFTGEYLFDSFGSINGNDPLFYLMSILYKSSDFMEVSYIESNHKLCITSVWSQEGDEAGPRGILLNNVLSMNEMSLSAERALENGDFLDFDMNQQNLLGLGDALENKSLPQGFDQLLNSNEIKDPFLQEHQDSINEFLDQMDEFSDSQLLNPEHFQGLDFDQFQNQLENYPEMEFLKDLSPEGFEELKDLAANHHKKDMRDVFKEEMELQKQQLDKLNPNFDEDFLRDSLLDEMAMGVDDLLDVDDLNKMLGQNDLMNEKVLNAKEKNEYSQKLGDFLNNDDFEGIKFDPNEGKKLSDEEISEMALENLEKVLKDQYGDDPWMQDPRLRQNLMEENPEFKLSEFDPDNPLNRIGGGQNQENGQQRVGGVFDQEDNLIKLSDLPPENTEQTQLNDVFDDSFAPLSLKDLKNEEEVSVFTPFDEDYHDAFVKNLGDIFDENGEKVNLADGLFNEDGEAVNLIGGAFDENGDWSASGGEFKDAEGNSVNLGKGVFDQDGNLITLKDVIEQTNDELQRVSEGLKEKEALQRLSSGVFDDDFQPIQLGDLGDGQNDPNQTVGGDQFETIDPNQVISGGRQEILDPFTEFKGISLEDEEKQILSSKYKDIDEFRQSVKGTSEDEIQSFVKDFQEEFSQGLKNFDHKETDLNKKKLALNELIDESLEKVTGKEKLDKYMRSYANTFAPSLLKESLKAAAMADQKMMEELSAKDLKKFAKNIAPETLKKLKESNSLQRGFENILLKGMKDADQLAAQNLEGMTDDESEQRQMVKGTPQQQMLQKYYKFHRGDDNLNKINQLFLTSKGHKDMKQSGAMRKMLKPALQALENMKGASPRDLTNYKDQLAKQMSDEFGLKNDQAKNIIEKSLGKLNQFENQALLDQVAKNNQRLNQNKPGGRNQELIDGDFNLLTLPQERREGTSQVEGEGNGPGNQENLIGGDFNLLSIDGKPQDPNQVNENTGESSRDSLSDENFNLLSLDQQQSKIAENFGKEDLLRLDPNKDTDATSPADDLRADGFSPIELEGENVTGQSATDEIEAENLAGRSNQLVDNEFDGIKLEGEGGQEDQSSQLIKGEGGQSADSGGMQLIKGLAQEAQKEGDGLQRGKIEGSNELSPEMLQQMQQNASSIHQRAVLGKLNNIQKEKDDIEKQLKAVKIQLETERAANSRLNEINKKASEQTDSILQDQESVDRQESNISNAMEEKKNREMEEMRKNLIKDIEKGKKPHEDDVKKMTKLLAKDNESVDKIRKLEGELRKNEISLTQKDTLIKAEIKKFERKEKTSKLLLDKAKESMKNAMMKKEKELQTLKSKIDKMSDELKKSKGGASEKKSRILKEENDELKQSNNMQKKSIKALQEKVQQLQNSNDTQDIEGKVKVLSREKDSLMSRLELERQEKETAKDEMAKLRIEDKTKTQKIASLEDESANLKKQLEMAKEKNAELEKKKAALEEGVASADKDLKMAQHSAESNNENAAKNVEEVKSLNEKLEKRNEEIAALKSESAQHQTKIKQLELKVKQAEAALKDQAVKANKNEDGASENEKMSAKMLEDLNKAKNEARDNMQKAKEADHKLKMALREVELLKKQAASGGGKAKSALEMSADKMASDLREAKKQIGKVKKESVQLKSENMALKNKVKQLEGEIKRKKKRGRAA